jgi:hypothetical protein
MRTQVGVQTSVSPVRIKATEDHLVLRARIVIALAKPKQDRHLPQDVEQQVEQAGQQVKRCLYRELMEKLDAELIINHRHGNESGGIACRGRRSMTFKTIFGTVTVSRHRIQHKCSGLIEVPAARVWQTPQQVTLTQGLKEAVCDAMLREPSRKSLREIEARAGEPGLLGRVTILDIVHQEGRALRQAAEARAKQVFEERPQAAAVLLPLAGELPQESPDELSEPSSQEIVEAEPLVGFPNAASAEAVEEDQPRQVDPQTLMVQMDEVVVQAQPSTGMQVIKVYTAVVHTQEQTWYFSAEAALPLIYQVAARLAACGVTEGKLRVLFLNDAARWIRSWFDQLKLPHKTMILCWYHLAQRIRDNLSMACRGRRHRDEVAQEVLGHLWEGRVDEALAVLARRREEMRCRVALRQVVEYIENRRPFLPNYAARRTAGFWIASTRVEKFNDWSVTQRCKHRGMSWTRDGVVALAVLESARRNRELTHWRQCRALPDWPIAEQPCQAA